MTVQLLTSQAEFEGLHEAADTKRTEIKVDQLSLSHLLIDHSVMQAALLAHGIKVSGPTRSRAKLEG